MYPDEASLRMRPECTRRAQLQHTPTNAPSTPSYGMPTQNVPSYSQPSDAPRYSEPSNAPSDSEPTDLPSYSEPTDALS